MAKAPSGLPSGTPMMRQYRAVKGQLPPNTLLLFRLGDFYELFFEDAKVAAPILDIALTRRQSVPMCGVPYQSADGYVAQLVRAGYKVALCDQVEDPRQAKGIVRRELTRIVTPGTVLQPDMLAADRNNYLAALLQHGSIYGLAMLDASTGEFRVTELPAADPVRSELARIRPAELLLPAAQAAALEPLAARGPAGPAANSAEDWWFDVETAYHRLADHFGTHSLDGFGCRGLTAGLGAAGALLQYVQETLRQQAAHITRLLPYQVGDYLALDPATERNLELLEPLHDGPRQATLLGVLNQTATPMGSRLLREWIRRPLKSLAPLLERQAGVADLVEQPGMARAVRAALAPIRDLERTLARITLGSGTARDLAALRAGLDAVPALRAALVPARAPILLQCRDQLHELPQLAEILRRAVVDEPPPGLREGGLIREGYDAGLDELRQASSAGKQWIANLQAKEQERTGIRSLKIRFNKVFGYYIEVTRSNLDAVPGDYVRRQTIAGGERFVTAELKEYEEKILGAEEKARAREYEIFLALRDLVMRQTEPVQQLAAAIARIDVLTSLADVAAHHGYCRPQLDDGLAIEIQDGRHPVLEQALVEERFVPNDLVIDGAGCRLLIITGPNMAGKSTFIRQAALLTLMAQIGSFIPARSARIGLADRIFTRVGAADDLARGQSTFMVEMSETANILHNSTGRSLVILDEIGRGTSTFDGLSIAWAVAEHLHDRVGARTLFATHYHELTELAQTHAGVQNLNVAVREWNDTIIFLRKIVPGAADKSYGIHVARLAGLPPSVLDRAKEVLANLEQNEWTSTGQPRLAQRRRQRQRPEPEGPAQLMFFTGDE